MLLLTPLLAGWLACFLPPPPLMGVWRDVMLQEGGPRIVSSMMID